MRATGLVDTGALLALLDETDAWHKRCVAAFQSLRYPLATSAAVITEFFHLLGPNPRDVDNAWRFLRSGAVQMLPITDDDTAELARLMKKYADRPMDFADATLVQLAKRESLTTIFTIDHNDFETYRIGSGRKFRIVPSR